MSQNAAAGANGEREQAMARDLTGKVFLVTGATMGIGKEACRDFARRGATLAIVGRSKEKTERVRAELVEDSGNDRIEVLIGDLSRVAEVEQVATDFRARRNRLDVLVNNAGAIFTNRQVSADGFELTFALNHLAYFVLTRELWGLLAGTPGARVVSTASAAHERGVLDLQDVAYANKDYSGWRAYGTSKLANILFTRELARRAGGQLIANCVHPGWVATGFALNNPGVVPMLIRLFGAVFARTPTKGAETIVWAATSPEAARLNGEYLHDCSVARTSDLAKDDALALGLWELSERLVASVHARRATAVPASH
jgi:NAD(P)-dependent dehydrogenase (short-subunit alcohol dehydrogenase family)